MRTALFVLLQFVAGFGFAWAGIFISLEVDSFAGHDAIIFVLLIGLTCQFLGVALAGFFHLRAIGNTQRFLTALIVSFIGMIAFSIFMLVVMKFVMLGAEFLTFFLPLTGAVFGFNLVAVRTGSTNSTEKISEDVNKDNEVVQ